MATVSEKTIDRLLLVRAMARRRFTMCANKLEEYLVQKEISYIIAENSKLTKYYDNLVTAQNNYLDIWLESDRRDEKDIEKESDIADEYESKWFYLEQKVKEIIEKGPGKIVKEASSTSDGGESQRVSRHLRLPMLELPKFNGEINKWLTFWTQFKKIDLDDKIDNEDKFQYLIQSMEIGTSARELVESFPPSAENYPKVLEQLKQRFARDDIIIEHYVRELLQLTLAQAKNTANSAIGPLYDKIMTQILALESLGVTQDKYAAFLFPMVESALPTDTLRAWSRSHIQAEKGSQLSKLLRFIKMEVESEERIHLARNKFSKDYCDVPTASCFTTANKNDKELKRYNTREQRFETMQTCIWCDKLSHTSSECSSPVKMTLEERRNYLKRKNACYICLKVGHMANKCRRHMKCIACQRRHYPIMCESLLRSKISKEEIVDKSNDEQTMLNQSETTKVGSVLLQTLMVNVVQGNKTVTVRALLDSGAQRSFIKKNIAEHLRLKAVKQLEICHTLFGGVVTKKQKHKVYEVNITSLDGNYQIKIEMLEQNNICGYLPKIRQAELLNKLQQKGIKITDCVNNVNEISLLIGSDVLGTILTGRSERMDSNLLATETELGWTVQGPAVGVYCSTEVPVSALSCSFDVDDLWKLETLGIRDDTEVRAKGSIEKEVVDFFEQTLKINDEGRYEIKLPWKCAVDNLNTNYDIAVNRVRATTKKLSKLGILADYNTVFQEWLDSGIIEGVNDDDIHLGHYLPHHAVIKESSLTTKIRPVFDASASPKDGFSLNDCLEKGANFIELIPRLIINFRKEAIGITADIKKAFLQISVNPEDRNYLKFLWWRDIDHIENGLQTYRHCRVVFGVTTSPFLLSATVLHHLNKYDSKETIKLRNSFYVDNCVVSVSSKEEMIQFIERAKEVMNEGKFELRCWVTGPIISDNEDRCTSVLGMMWDPKEDELFCKVPVITNDLGGVTKRVVLSIAQSIFDPMGFVCPVTLVPKLVIQQCWIKNIDWDTELPAELAESIHNWLKHIECLNKCRFPRRISNSNLVLSDNTLHIFSDASQSAYSVCIFLRSELNSVVSVQLIIAKSRVTPTKRITMPRLELIAALLGTRLAAEVKESLQINMKEYYWSDSSIVLAWIRRKVSLNVFVHNRVTEIVRRTNIEDWRHVPGDLNPADLPSRGCNAQQLVKSRWWEGPAWLKRSSLEWPTSNPIPNEEEVSKEVKKSTLTMQIYERFSNRLLYFSKYSKIVRTVAWCFKFVRNCQKEVSKRNRTGLSGKEYEDAEKKLLKLIQRENQEVLNDFKIVTVQNEGLTCVKTRLTLAEDSENFKYPILLPSKNIIIERLVVQTHLAHHHAGSQTLINYLRDQFWIIGIRRLAKKTVRECVICRRHSAKSCNLPLPPLPLNRIKCGNAFEIAGVDLAGPLNLRSGEKCWVVLFTCATYRAVHLEITLSLSTEDFLLAFKRFVARRGNVKIMYSDNGTNFRGTKSILDTVDWQDAAARTSVNKIEWRFIPPQAPWWGGFWERMVGLMKNIMRRMLGKALLNQMELYTALCEVEAVINARPITYVSDNTENLKPLTPSMFLHNKLESHSNLEYLDPKNLTVRWKYIQKLVNDLKIRFRNEYLSALVERKCKNRSQTVNVGDIVLIGSDGLKRVNWPLGIVLNIYAGIDGLCRVAQIKTSNGVLIRPLQRLYPLEVSTTKEQVTATDSGLDCGQPNAPDDETLPERFTRSGRLVRIPRKLDL